MGGLVGCSVVLVSGAASFPQFMVPARSGGLPDWLRGPLSGTGYLLRPGDLWILVGMTGAYGVAVLCASGLDARWLATAVAGLHAIFLLGPPLMSADVFGYLDWARMAVLHGLSPYTTASGAVVSDPIHPFVGWDRLSSPYGPLFTLGTYAVVPLGLAGSVWAMKVVVTAASLGCAGLIWRCARALGRSPQTALALYGLNPAVLVYAVGGFHNDALMMLAVVGAIHLLVTGRERGAAVSAAAAVAIKSSAGLVVPFLIAGASDRRRTLAAVVAAGVVGLLVSLLVFGWPVLHFLDVLGTQQQLNSGSSVPAQLGAWFGWSGSPPAVRIVASTTGAVAVVVFVVRAWRGADWISSAGWATLSLLITTSWLLAWYVVWLVPLAALSRSRGLRLAAVGMTIFVLGVRVVPRLG